MDKKKSPLDYPQLSFRISKEDKININSLAEEVLEASNAGLEPGKKVFRKNAVLVDALYLGLLTLKNKRTKIC
jgi:hypothetical protein